MTKCFILMVFLNFNFRSNARRTGNSTCSTSSNVLFNKVLSRCDGDHETLQLMCRVNDLDLGAYILHNGKEKAACVSFLQLFCSNGIGNITKTDSGDIVFTVRTKERGVLNGTWTCRNGAGDKNDHSSIDVPSINCESPTVYTKDNEEISNTKYGLLLIVLPLVVFIATVVSLRCCIIKESSEQDLLKRVNCILKKIVCLWACCVSRHDMVSRNETETGVQCFYCFLLLCVYSSAAGSFYCYGIETELEKGLLVAVCILGIIVAICIPIIWRAKYGLDDQTVVDTPGQRVGCDECQSRASSGPVETQSPRVGCNDGESLARASSRPGEDDQSFGSYYSAPALSSGDLNNDRIQSCEVRNPLIAVQMHTE